MKRVLSLILITTLTLSMSTKVFAASYRETESSVMETESNLTE